MLAHARLNKLSPSSKKVIDDLEANMSILGTPRSTELEQISSFQAISIPLEYS
jgi:hypothetical protein